MEWIFALGEEYEKDDGRSTEEEENYEERRMGQH
jgi:hypothetical protein